MRSMCMDSALGKEDLGLGTVFCSCSVGSLHLDLFLREERAMHNLLEIREKQTLWWQNPLICFEQI